MKALSGFRACPIHELRVHQMLIFERFLHSKSGTPGLNHPSKRHQFLLVDKNYISFCPLVETDVFNGSGGAAAEAQNRREPLRSHLSGLNSTDELFLLS